jgi:NADPH-dependent ferric siderophore reductase
MVPITATSVERLAPRATRVRFSDMTLIESVRPACFLSLSFSDPARSPRDDSDGAGRRRRRRSDRRTFTPRAMSAIARNLTVDFVLHGEGPASTWAAAAQAGRVIWAGPTKGGYTVPPPGSHLVLIGDDTAIPAIGTIIEAVDTTVRVTTVLEVVDRDDEREVTPIRDVDPIWVHRGPDPAQTGVLTTNLVETLTVPDDAYWWVAGEREAILAMRDLLFTERHVPRDRLDLNAHWRLRPADPRLA